MRPPTSVAVARPSGSPRRGDETGEGRYDAVRAAISRTSVLHFTRVNREMQRAPGDKRTLFLWGENTTTRLVERVKNIVF
jgi:hypothetical protein